MDSQEIEDRKIPFYDAVLGADGKPIERSREELIRIAKEILATPVDPKDAGE
jgi:hypothetical protein